VPTSRRLRLALLTVAVAAGCGSGCGGKGPAAPAAERTATRAASPLTRSPALCRALRASVTGRVRIPGVDELSGLVASRRRAGIWWSHEDSGAGPVLWALRGDGSPAGRWDVAGAGAVDWEDIAAGPGPDGQPVLYVADIGDNAGSRASIDVYRVPEPGPGSGTTAPAARLALRYPDGAHDAEALLVDPRRGTLVVVTKGLTGGRAYALPAPLPFGGSAMLRRGPRIGLGLVTAGDVSRNGAVVALRGYGQLAVWTRRGREPLTTTLRRPPCTSPTTLADGQGESLALDSTGTSFRTVPEGPNAPMRRYTPR
jgi:hypothetical protein